jgi:hypothetical protein
LTKQQKKLFFLLFPFHQRKRSVFFSKPVQRFASSMVQKDQQVLHAAGKEMDRGCRELAKGFSTMPSLMLGVIFTSKKF